MPNQTGTCRLASDTPLGRPLFIRGPRLQSQPPDPLPSPSTFSPCDQNVGRTRVLPGAQDGWAE